MIQANELRIENWITHNNPNLAPKYIRVHSIGEKGINYWPNVEEPAAVKIEFATLEPIPITPEILEKAGFKLAYNTANYYQHKFDIMDLLSQEGGYFLQDYELNICSIKILYLHQLQNLVHALTGKELEINL